VGCCWDIVGGCCIGVAGREMVVMRGIEFVMIWQEVADRPPERPSNGIAAA
jgi:hypothetical protein